MCGSTTRPIAAVSPMPILRHAPALMQPALARSVRGRATVRRGLGPRAVERFMAAPGALALRLRLVEGRRRSTAERHPMADGDLMGADRMAVAEGILRWVDRTAAEDTSRWVGRTAVAEDTSRWVGRTAVAEGTSRWVGRTAVAEGTSRWVDRTAVAEGTS